MKKLNIKWMLSLIAAFTFASCDTDVDHEDYRDERQTAGNIQSGN
mgnify:CR=1 FL=1